jgi:hypothetical protein
VGRRGKSAAFSEKKEIEMSKLEIVTDGEPENSAKPDPFNLDALRLDPAFEKIAGVKKVLSIVPVRKPHDQEWFWVNSAPAYRIDFWAIKLKDEGEFYLVTPQIARDHEAEVKPFTLYTCVNTSGVVILWPARISTSEKRDNWSASAHEAAQAGMKQRIRIKANMSLGGYEVFTSDSPTPGAAPLWPTESLGELVNIAFMKVGRYVDSAEHPIMRQLLGRV